MKIAVTFPGKIGDLLWALPTVRAISRSYDEPVHLFVSQYLAPLVELLNMQPYIAEATALSDWAVQFGAPVTPRMPPFESYGQHDKVFHLGFEGWPMQALPYEALGIAWQQEDKARPIRKEHFSLSEPWISVPILNTWDAPTIAVGFTDEWFELKYGIVELLRSRGVDLLCLFAASSRWQNEGRDESELRARRTWGWYGRGWVETACIIRNAHAFLGCCSSLHVLSAGLGKPTIVVEPNPHRHHMIFWPCGIDGQVQMVLGGDSNATFDARHTYDLVRRFL